MQFLLTIDTFILRYDNKDFLIIFTSSLGWLNFTFATKETSKNSNMTAYANMSSC